MKYQVTVKHWVSYDVEVEADDFQDAATKAEEAAVKIEGDIIPAIEKFVPDEVFNDSASEVIGVYLLS